MHNEAENMIMERQGGGDYNIYFHIEGKDFDSIYDTL